MKLVVPKVLCRFLFEKFKNLNDLLFSGLYCSYKVLYWRHSKRRNIVYQEVLEQTLFWSLVMDLEQA